MNIAFLGLGGNIGNRMVLLERAIQELNKASITVLQRSAVFETEPWGTDSTNNFLNMVVRIGTHLGPMELLQVCLHIEKKLGRKRGSKRYADRTMDIDILYFNEICLNTETLQIPHPRLHERKFVLGPLSQLAPDFKDPFSQKKISTLLKKCPDRSSITFYSYLKPRLICIEGNIGSGKTSLSKTLAAKFKFKLEQEEFEKENLVKHFYKQPSLAMSVEFNFMLQRFFQLEKFAHTKQPVICDFSFYRSLWFAAASLNKEEFQHFSKQFEKLNKQIIQPDLLIHLQVPVSELEKNIRKRGREMERDLSSNYLKKLENSYQTNYLISGIPTLTIELKHYRSDSQERLARHVQKVLKENFVE